MFKLFRLRSGEERGVDIDPSYKDFRKQYDFFNITGDIDVVTDSHLNSTNTTDNKMDK